MEGTDDLTRVLRELFDRTSRMQQSVQRHVSLIKSYSELPGNGDRVNLDDTQPSATPKWADAVSWSRTSNNIKWSEGALWQ